MSKENRVNSYFYVTTRVMTVAMALEPAALVVVLVAVNDDDDVISHQSAHAC